MKLSTLDSKGLSPNIILVQCPCTALSMFIEDKAKRVLRSTQDTVFSIKSKKDFKDLRMLGTVQPFQSNKWLYFIDLDKIQPDKELYSLMAECVTVCFFLTCSKYSIYKEVKDKFKNSSVLDFYLSFLRSDDFYYLYNEYVRKSSNKDILTQELVQYVKDGYSSDLDALMELFEYLKDYDEKEEVTKSKIVELCGVGGNTLDSFVFALLKDAPKPTERSFKTVLRKRFQAGSSLAESYEWGQFYNYLNKALYNIICIKELLISNEIYKGIYNLPDGYDEKVLSKYSRHLWRIKEIPMSRVLRLKASLSDSMWNSPVDFMLFMYKYYEAQVVSETLRR